MVLRKVLIVFGICLALILCSIYNIHHLCSWQSPESTKILLLADPQIEGIHRAQREKTGHLANQINDHFQHFVVSSLMDKLKPDVVVLLGDIFSFQYLDTKEHALRYQRFLWIFESVLSSKALFINVTGNHDVGYGAEISNQLLSTFEKAFGPVNSQFEFGGHVLANLNSLNLDGSKDKALQGQTKKFLKSLQDSTLPILLFTHLPMHKNPSPCTDQPKIVKNHLGQVTQQNFLSPESTNEILNVAKPVAIFTGHDHDGCKFLHRSSVPEYTVRSMMGDFDGNAGLFEMKQQQDGKYAYHYADCQFVRMPVITFLLIACPTWLVLFLLVALCCSGSGVPQDKPKKD